MTAFRSEGELREWLDSKGYRLGAAIAPQTLYDLGSEWYAGRLDVDFQPLTVSEKEALFEKHGLVGEFWSIRG